MQQLPVTKMRSINNKDIGAFIVPILLIQTIIKMNCQLVDIRKEIHRSIVFGQPPAGFSKSLFGIILVKGFKHRPPVNLIPDLRADFIIRCIPLRQGQETAKIVKINPVQIAESIELLNRTDPFSWIITIIINSCHKLLTTQHKIAKLFRFFLVTKLIQAKVNILGMQNLGWHFFSSLEIVKHP
ncbi:hypothetical protein PMJEKBHI_00382 [Lacticaseibacillus rhamnosus]|nr:hypothetical protein PMJEKBHI_00382 [Lacticaseibacillus rhamnosus]